MSLKILLIGNSGVGKSSVLTRFSDNKFSAAFYNTIGVDFVLLANTESQNGRLPRTARQTRVGTAPSSQWDTAGQERFRTITNSYYRGANGIIIVYDITDKNSFDNVRVWYEEMVKYALLLRNVNQRVSCILVGNKLDMHARRAVSQQ